jgi:hypothetical protein
MGLKCRAFGLAGALALCSASAQATAVNPRPAADRAAVAQASMELVRIARTIPQTTPLIFVNKPASAPPAAAPAASGAKPRSAPPAQTARAQRPVLAVTSAGMGQTGYVHYFLLRLPDETTEIQVGIELEDQRIAWSFPGLGAVVSPFIDEGIVTAGGQDYEVWHLYGLRPFADDAAMALLGRELAARIEPYIRARTPYCLQDSVDSACLSCLGFVLRALYPGPRGGFPALPAGFWRASMGSHYTTNDLLLYLTGMLDLPTRDARLRRIAGLALPEQLRDDLEALVYSMGATEAAPAAAQKRPEGRPARIGVRPQQRKGS